MKINRREFLLHGAGGAALAATGLSVPRILARTAAAATRDDGAGRILVMVQLTGGNDGLNTVVPWRDDLYRFLRPTLGVQPGQVLRLNDDVGLAPQLGGLKSLFDDGWLSVVQGVGYPNANRSHFQSMDIWHTADPTLRSIETGWLGRVIEQQPGMEALHLDDAGLPLALRAAGVDVPSIRSIESFRLQGASDSQVRRAVEAAIGSSSSSSASADAADDVEFVRRTAVAACANARRLEALPDEGAAGYPPFGLARRLREIARLIAAEFGPRIYYTSLGGFDTHARQNTVHPNLMSELGQSLRAFFDDLRDMGLAERVLLMTFSEFGRRAAENAGQGTDHGAAAPVFVACPRVSAGVLGPRPDLSALVDGDVPHAIDFRGIYATVLRDWLDVPPASVLGGRFETLPLIG
jgi:uncharacterized protein (DUF1501 family)